MMCLEMTKKPIRRKDNNVQNNQDIIRRAIVQFEKEPSIYRLLLNLLS